LWLGTLDSATRKMLNRNGCAKSFCVCFIHDYEKLFKAENLLSPKFKDATKKFIELMRQVIKEWPSDSDQ